MKRASWTAGYIYLKNKDIVYDDCDNKFDGVSIDYIFATDWEIYNEPKPEPKFEIGGIGYDARDRIDLKWFPEHFAHYEPKEKKFHIWQ